MGVTGRIYIDKRRMKKTTTLHCVQWAKKVVEDDVVRLISVELPSPSFSISLFGAPIRAGKINRDETYLAGQRKWIGK